MPPPYMAPDQVQRPQQAEAAILAVGEERAVRHPLRMERRSIGDLLFAPRSIF
jgi:hypothetical protein